LFFGCLYPTYRSEAEKPKRGTNGGKTIDLGCPPSHPNPERTLFQSSEASSQSEAEAIQKSQADEGECCKRGTAEAPERSGGNEIESPRRRKGRAARAADKRTAAKPPDKDL